MRPGRALLAALLVVPLGAPTIIAVRRLAAAQDRLEHARQAVREAAVSVDHLRRLRRTEPRVDDVRRPEQDLIARISAALAAAGLPEQHFGALDLGRDAALPGSAGADLVYRRQSVRVSLRALAVPELGRFLAAWADAQPLWSPQRIDLTRPAGRSAEGRYDVTLVIEATYVDRRSV